jgi:hypothetical protein
MHKAANYLAKTEENQSWQKKAYAHAVLFLAESK